MALADSIKRAPRWAWVTAGGVGIAAAGVKLWNNRGKPADETEVVAQEIGDPSSPYPLPMSTGNPVATIVPPVIIGGGGGDNSAFGLQGLHDTYIGAIDAVLQSYAEVWGPVQTTHLMLTQGNADTIQALAMAGSPPGGASMPEALIPYTPPAPVAQQPLPAPPPRPVDACRGAFPHKSSRGCYKVACATGSGKRRKGRWNLYDPNPKLGNGAEIFVGPTC